MKRLLINDLLDWKSKKNRKPLLLRGGRQVGKTFVAREFGKNFDNFVEFNLEAEPSLHSIFKEYFGNPEELIRQLSLLSGQKIEPKKTLLFLDEVQSCKEALISLRYFFEKLPNLHVLAAGSLIEFALKEISFPVGRVEYMHLFPLNFKEFLMACNEEALTQIQLKDISQALHEKLLKLLKQYIFVGGMPEVVREFITTKNLKECSNIQTTIISNYRDDFNKYSRNANLFNIRKIFDAIPRLLSQKFKYSNVSDDIQSRELSKSLDLLVLAGLAYKCHHSSSNGVPLSSEIDPKKFKLYFIDIGLCLNILGVRIEDFPKFSIQDLINKGGLAEQFMAQEILSITNKNKHPQLFYWGREQKSSSAEVDFIFEHKNELLPFEVKSGVNKGRKSLKIFMDEKNIKNAFLFSLDSDLNKDKNGVQFLPLYSFFIVQNLYLL